MIAPSLSAPALYCRVGSGRAERAAAVRFRLVHGYGRLAFDLHYDEQYILNTIF